MSGADLYQQNSSGHLQLAGHVINTESDQRPHYHETNELVDLLDVCQEQIVFPMDDRTEDQSINMLD